MTAYEEIGEKVKENRRENEVEHNIQEINGTESNVKFLPSDHRGDVGSWSAGTAMCRDWFTCNAHIYMQNPKSTRHERFNFTKIPSTVHSNHSSVCL